MYMDYGENIAGDDNQLRDRDSIAAEVTYSF